MKRALDTTGLACFLELRDRALPHQELAERQDEVLPIGCSCLMMDDR
jgi:hypothetical protein